MPQNRTIDIKRVESSPTEPVTLTEAKSHLIISFTDDDTLISSLITQARKIIENYCAISIVAQTVTLIADLFNEWELPYGPVTGIQSVATRTGNEGSGPGIYETQTSGWVQEGEQFITFIPAGTGFNAGAPFTGHFQWGPYASKFGQYPGNRYKIVYTTGYSTVPDDLKLSILHQIAFMYENRGNQDISSTAQAFAFPYKRTLWF